MYTYILTCTTGTPWTLPDKCSTLVLTPLQMILVNVQIGATHLLMADCHTLIYVPLIKLPRSTNMSIFMHYYVFITGTDSFGGGLNPGIPHEYVHAITTQLWKLKTLDQTSQTRSR